MFLIFKLIIKQYQKLSKILFPNTCRFSPSCSQYTIDAVERHGFAKGCVMALKRIIKCTPFSVGGYDPIR